MNLSFNRREGGGVTHTQDGLMNISRKQNLFGAGRKMSKLNKRRQTRVPVSELSVEITDGYENFQGILKNVSFDGLRVEVHSKEMTRRKDTHTYKLKVLLENETFILKAFPRWEEVNSEKSGVGFRVFNAPRDWYKFVMDS